MELQDMTRVIQVREKAISLSFWDIGRDLAKIKDEHLHTVKYDTFNEYIEDNFKFSTRHANRMIAVANEYKKDTVSQIGLSKLYILLQVPEEEREEIIELVEETGMGRDELAKKVKRFKSQAGVRTTDQAEEHTLKLKRQFEVLEDQYINYIAIREDLKVGLNNWLDEAKKSKIEKDLLVNVMEMIKDL